MADIQRTVELACRFHEVNNKPYSSCYRNAERAIDLIDHMTRDNAFDATTELCSLAPTNDSWSRLFKAHANFGIGKLGYDVLKSIVQAEFSAAPSAAAV